jgi:hypothetical protein
MYRLPQQSQARDKTTSEVVHSLVNYKEVALPLDTINRAAVLERSIRLVVARQSE